MDHKRKQHVSEDHLNTKKQKISHIVDDENNEPHEEHNEPHEQHNEPRGENNEPCENESSTKINKKFAHKAQKFVDAMSKIDSWNCDPGIDIAYFWNDDFVDLAEYRRISSTCTQKYKRTIIYDNGGMAIVKKRKFKDYISTYMYRSNNSLNSDDDEQNESHEDESSLKTKDNFAQKTQKILYVS
ncbi:unnamed protein product [Aphis gossypii]|uniref:Uncharacterized protein n=1 Tax=Aphis gossypii TaxID=80765 RepID=A0A9P0N9K3_APHGO|nr:unnamed protein product [Aphis gossypii]